MMDDKLVIESLLDVADFYMADEMNIIADGNLYSYDEFKSYVTSNPGLSLKFVVSFECNVLTDIYYNNGVDNIHLFIRGDFSNVEEKHGNMINVYELIHKIPDVLDRLFDQDEVITDKVKAIFDAYLKAKRELVEAATVIIDGN